MPTVLIAGDGSAHANRAVAYLIAAVAQLQQAGIGFTAHSRVGAPGASIVACAKELDCQSIVIGSHGAGLTLGSLLGSLLGSVASEVVRLSEVPVTLVK